MIKSLPSAVPVPERTSLISPISIPMPKTTESSPPATTPACTPADAPTQSGRNAPAAVELIFHASIRARRCVIASPVPLATGAPEPSSSNWSSPSPRRTTYWSAPEPPFRLSPSPAPPARMSSPAPPVIMSAPSPPSNQSEPSRPLSVSLPAPPSR